MPAKVQNISEICKNLLIKISRPERLHQARTVQSNEKQPIIRRRKYGESTVIIRRGSDEVPMDIRGM